MTEKNRAVTKISNLLANLPCTPFKKQIVLQAAYTILDDKSRQTVLLHLKIISFVAA